MRVETCVAILLAACGNNEVGSLPPTIRPCTQLVERSQLLVRKRGIDALNARAIKLQDPRTSLSLMFGMNWPVCALRISFVDQVTSPYLRGVVMRAAARWHEAVGMTFTESSDPDAEVRVTFGGTVNQAWIGSSAIGGVGAGDPTMFLGSFETGATETVLFGIALHELGHTLGAPHEHQTPLANIEWNKPVVTAYYQTELHWSDQQIEENVYKQYTSQDVDQVVFDPTSIMMYPLRADWTEHGTPVVGNNTALSPRDVAFMRDVYGDCLH